MMTESERQMTNDETKSFKILFIGDIVAEIGRTAVKRVIDDVKREHQIDFTIANGEHLSDRVGLNIDAVKEMEKVGIDFFTTGNHVWRQRKFQEHIGKEDVPVVRPANYPKDAPGEGFRIVETPKGKILIVNLLGREGISASIKSPFETIDGILKEAGDFKYSFIDFHAEMTSEKVALGRYLDGRVSAVVGTHTHVPTADQRVLSKGTAVVSDVGFVGPRESVLGVRDDIIFNVFLTGMPQTFEVASGDCDFNAVVIELDEQSGLAKSIQRVDKIVKL